MVQLSKQQRLEVQKLLGKGWSYNQIARHLSISTDTIWRWAHRAGTERPVDNLPHRPGPRKVTPAVRRSIRLQARANPYLPLRRSARILKSKGFDVSAATIRHVRLEEGLHAFKRPRRQGLTAAQKRKRLEFCKAYKKQDWRRAVFSDEHRFSLSGRKVNPQHNFYWSSEPTQAAVMPQQRWAAQFTAWGGIAAWGCTPLVEIKDSLDANAYGSILKKQLIPWLRASKPAGEYLFQQDGARPHVAASVTTILNTNRIPFIGKEQWPPNSPDLNPIENLWARMDDELSKKSITTRRGLLTAARSIFKKLTIDQLCAYIDSMPHRIEACIKAKGGLFQL